MNIQSDIKKQCRKIGRDAAHRGRSLDLALSVAITATHRAWIRQGYDTYQARHSDRRAA